MNDFEVIFEDLCAKGCAGCQLWTGAECEVKAIFEGTGKVVAHAYE